MDAIHWLAMVALTVSGLGFVGLAALKQLKWNFAWVVLAGFAGGLLAGVVFKGSLEYLTPLSAIYIKVITALVVPLVVISILSSLSSIASTKDLRFLGTRSVFWLLLNTLLASLLALGVGLGAGVGKGADLILADLPAGNATPVTFQDVLIGFFPGNLVKDWGGNSLIPLILTAVIVAVALVLVRDRHPEHTAPLEHVLTALKAVIDQLVRFLVSLTPYGVFVLAAQATARADSVVALISPLAWLLVVTFAVCFVHAFLVNGTLVAFFARLSPVKFFGAIADAQLTAFTTQTSVGTLPVTTHALTTKLGISKRVAHFVAPLGTTIGMPGCAGIWPIMLAVFAIQALGIPYTPVQYGSLILLSLLVSLGTAGVPGTATITATSVFAAAGLPVGIILLTLPISTIADMARTATNVTAAAASAVIVQNQETARSST